MTQLKPSLIVSSPSPGTYQIHEEGQRPVEGCAVYDYTWGFECERHPGGRCLHVNLVLEFRRKNNAT